MREFIDEIENEARSEFLKASGLDDEQENELDDISILEDTKEYFESFYCGSKEKAERLMRIENISLKKALEGAQTKNNWRFTKYENLF